MIRLAFFLLAIYFLYVLYKTIQKHKEEPKIKNLGKAKVVVTTPCPDPKTFLDYTEGKIIGKKKEDIRRHIDSCKDCMSALQSLFDISAKEGLKS